MKLAIVGSRTFNDYEKLGNSVATYFSIWYETNSLNIISGGAKGADKLAEKFAELNDIKITIFEPDWDKYGKSAGFRRNQQIVDTCDMVLAFWDGESKGTKDSIEKAKIAKKPTLIIYI